MTPEFLTALPQAIREALVRFTEQPDGGLRDFLVAEVGTPLADTITSVVGQIDARSREVAAAREAGQSAARWLGGVLEETGAIGVLGSIPGLLEGDEGTPTEAARRLLTGGALSLGTITPLPIVPEGLLDALEAAGPALEMATGFFESPLGHGIEAQVKTVATAAAVGLCGKLGLDVEPRGLTAAIDLGLTVAKVGYKVATGEVDGLDAAELIEDRLAAGMATLAGEAVELGLEVAGGALGASLGAFVGAPTVGAYVGRTLGAMAGGAVRGHVERGTARVTKAVLRGAKELVRDASRRVGAWVTKLAAGVLG